MDELPPDVDATRHARYWIEAFNGVVMRMALLSPGARRRGVTSVELIILNGEPVSVEPREGESLLELLREHLGLRSMKDGCAPEGSCGACTVIVDGHAVVSCAQKATRVAGKHVVTQEGLPEETRRSGPTASSPPARRSAASARRAS